MSENIFHICADFKKGIYCTSIKDKDSKIVSLAVKRISDPYSPVSEIVEVCPICNQMKNTPGTFKDTPQFNEFKSYLKNMLNKESL